MSENLELLKACLPYVEEAAEEQGGYGFWCGGDPRTFHPDCESCTPEEIANHKKACEEADAAEAQGKIVDVPCQSGWISPGVHITKSPFGIGSYTYRDEQAVKVLDALRAALGLEKS